MKDFEIWRWNKCNRRIRKISDGCMYGPPNNVERMILKS